VASETLGGLPTPSGSAAQRFSFTEAPASYADFLGSRQSSNGDFTTARSYYQMVRLNSQIFVIGGASASGVLNSVERHGQ
jgi:hypothetical protein